MKNEELAEKWMEWRRKNAADYDEPPWLEGMRDADGVLVADSDLNGEVRWYQQGVLSRWMKPDPDEMPDMNWPPNMAYLRIDAQRAWGEEYEVCLYFDGSVHVCRGRKIAFDNLAAALIAAPEAK